MTVGILGGGQLGRMMALAGYPLGQSFLFLDPGRDACGGQVAPLCIGAYDDEESLSEIARRSDVVTYEFESVPVASARFLESRVRVYPPPTALEVSQDRLSEKDFFRAHGIPSTEYIDVPTLDSLQQAAETLGYPCVLKTRKFGYDGKGQRILHSPADVESAWAAMGAASLILESFVSFDAEVSLICIRSRAGDVRFYPLIQNEHLDGILRVSIPRGEVVTDALQAAAEAYAEKALRALDYVGVLTVEFFVKDGALYANEMAPRVHNSGHFSIEGAEVSQFENHIRAVVGMPLGSTDLVGHSAMVNVIGAFPSKEAREQLLGMAGVHIHDYGKGGAPGRKVGHITIRCDERASLNERLARVRSLVEGG